MENSYETFKANELREIINRAGYSDSGKDPAQIVKKIEARIQSYIDENYPHRSVSLQNPIANMPAILFFADANGKHYRGTPAKSSHEMPGWEEEPSDKPEVIAWTDVFAEMIPEETLKLTNVINSLFSFGMHRAIKIAEELTAKDYDTAAEEDDEESRYEEEK